MGRYRQAARNTIFIRVKAGTFVLVLLAGICLATPAVAARAEFPICGAGKRVTCVVDGDTVWFESVKYRLEDIDTPEKGALSECMQERRKDRDGRTLARFVIGDTTAGEMLVKEGLARPWRGRAEEWCG